MYARVCILFTATERYTAIWNPQTVYSISSLADCKVLYSVRSNNWKIADFGFTAEGSSKIIISTLSRGTTSYRAPELLQEDPLYTRKVDVWAVGCILYEVVTKQKRFGSDWQVKEYSIAQGTPRTPEIGFHYGRSQQVFSEIINKTLSIKWSQRPSAASLVKMLQDFQSHLKSVIEPQLNIATRGNDLTLSSEPLESISSFSRTNYALRRQQLNRIVKALRDRDTEEVIKLPKIAIIGYQSAGKSSLIEAISQIKVPRGSFATRCPMEVVLTSAPRQNKWHCKVSLRVDHCDVEGHRQGVFEFDETNVPEEVHHILRRAQLAILNPSMHFSHFYRLDKDECNGHAVEIHFSLNTVVVEIAGGDVDVTLIDLPGIVMVCDWLT